MDGEDSLDPRELQETLQTYRKLANDLANHDTILKVSAVRSTVELLLLQNRRSCFINFFYNKTHPLSTSRCSLLQDKTVLSYIAYVLEVPDLDVVNLALEILEIFVKNVDNYIHITSTFGVRESLDAIINKYSLSEPKIADRAQYLKDDIERMKPPIYNLRSRCRRVIEPKKLKTHVIVLHVQGLLPVSESFLFVIIVVHVLRKIIDLIIN